MSCLYCRGEQPLFDNTREDGGWHAEIRPLDFTIVARFQEDEKFNFARGELELDVEYCPMCGTALVDAARETLGEDEW